MKLIFLLLFCIAIEVNAEERILDFHSRINVLEDGSIHVIESIKVKVENRRIRHGIYRSAPTVYYGVFFTQHNSNINIVNTKLDGKEVGYNTQRLVNGIRVYLGSKNHYVNKGIHTYQIEYIAERQVVNLDQGDGIYWNVTGNDWNFQIDHASADVYFPMSTEVLKYDAWTGKHGSKQQHFTHKIYPDHIHFETTTPLYRHHGFTIQTVWQDGLVIHTNETWEFIKDNLFWFLSIFMLLLFPLYFYLSWKRVGIDPPKKPIFPRFKPPNDISPAAVRFIKQNYYDGKSFSCAIMSLAIKNYITIEQISSKKYSFTTLNKPNKSVLSVGEEVLYNQLFANKREYIIDDKYDTNVKVATDLLKDMLTAEYQYSCYLDNNKYWYVGVALSMIALFFNWGHFFNFSNYASKLIFMPIIAIAASAIWLVATKKPYMKLLAVVVPTLVIIVGLYMQTDKIYIAYGIIFLLILLTNALFYYLIQAPTVFGRKLLDKIAGFRMYLATSEQDRLELMHPPTMTPELFEKYLPYALALGVENSWSEQFNNAMKIQGKDAISYQPHWYIGNNYSSFNFATSVSAFGAGLASSVAAASTPPSSSGGFGGGGFSGGGGGGGGGGGW